MAGQTVTTEVAAWMDANFATPRYIVHTNGRAIAVSFETADDEMLFMFKWPELVPNVSRIVSLIPPYTLKAVINQRFRS